MKYPLRILADLEDDLKENERDIHRTVKQLDELKDERISIMKAIDEVKRYQRLGRIE